MKRLGRCIFVKAVCEELRLLGIRLGSQSRVIPQNEIQCGATTLMYTSLEKKVAWSCGTVARISALVALII